MKVCSKCKIEKPKTEFSKCSRANDGLQTKCAACYAEYYAANKEKIAEYYAANKEKIAEYYAANKEKIAEYYAANKEKIAVQVAEYRAANKEKIAVQVAKYHAANREKINARKAEYHAANKEKIRVRKAECRAANPDKFVARHAAWVAANPDKKTAASRNRRARKRNAEGKHTAADVRAIFDKQQGLCANCQTKLFKSGKQKYHVDHIMPLALGGSNWPSNLQCLCPQCNLSKWAKHPDEWAKQQGRLL